LIFYVFFGKMIDEMRDDDDCHDIKRPLFFKKKKKENHLPEFQGRAVL